jgi:hypothetical protein
MGWTLVQSAVSNAPTRTGTTSGALAPTATLGATTPGNLLVICSVGQAIGSTPTIGLASISGGGTWNTRGSWGDSQTSGTIWKGGGVFSFIDNVGSFSGTVTVTYNFGATGVSRVDTAQFVIMEFSGAVTSGTYLDGGGTNLGNASVPDPGLLFSTASNELVVSGYVGNTGPSGLPTGFSSPGSLSGMAYAGVVYKLNAPVGQTAAWSSGSQAKWGAGAHTVFGLTASELVQTDLMFF